MAANKKPSKYNSLGCTLAMVLVSSSLWSICTSQVRALRAVRRHFVFSKTCEAGLERPSVEVMLGKSKGILMMAGKLLLQRSRKLS